MDPAIAEAITLEVGHPVPFRDEELDSIVDLVVHRARGISGLERCRSLRILILSGYGSGEIPDLGGFPALRSLTVSDSDVRDIGAVRTAPSLLVLNMERNLVADISPTLECAGLTLLDVRGNPLSECRTGRSSPSCGTRASTYRLQKNGNGPSPAHCTRRGSRSPTTSTAITTACPVLA